MKKLSRKLSKFSLITGGNISYLSLFLVLNVFAIVVMRYFFDFSLIWQNELSKYLNSIIFLSAAGYTLYFNNHVRVDVFYEKFSRKTRSTSNIIGFFLFLLPLCLGIIYFSFNYVLSSFSMLESSPEPNGMLGLFILKSFILLFAFSLLIQGFANIINSVKNLRSSR